MNLSISTRVLLNFALVLFSPTLTQSVSSFWPINERIDHPRTAHQKHSVARGHDTPTRQIVQPQNPPGSVYGLPRIPGQTRVSLPEVSVNCSSHGVIVRVKRTFFGFSPSPEELTLGDGCKSNGVLTSHNDLLFVYPLTDCQSEKQVLPDYIVYKYLLRYVPLSDRTYFRSQQVTVGVECRFRRHHHVQSEVVRSTLRKSIRSRLGDFRIQLMDDSWSSVVGSAVFMLGQRINVQVSTQHQYPGVKLYINSCYVTTPQNVNQTTKYSIIDNFGCLRESLINPDARFRVSKSDNIVQFSFDAFQFIDAPDAQVSLHCEVFVSGGGFSPVQKSCVFNHLKNRWISVSGHDSVCGCCDSVCNHTKTKRLTYEGFISSDQVVFADPVTSSSSTLAHNNDEAIWFEVTNVSQSPHTHRDLDAFVSLSSSEDHFKMQNESHTSPVELIGGVKKVMEGDVEILMATSESLLVSERPEENIRWKNKETKQMVDSMEQVASLVWLEDKMKQNLVKGQSNRPKNDFAKPPLSVEIKTMKESSKIDDSTDGEQQDFILSSVIAEEEGSSAYEKENLSFVSHSDFEEKSLFLVGFDDLMEQGVVKKMDYTKDPDYYFIPEEF